MCIICEKGRSLATLYQILFRLEKEEKKETDTYRYVQTKATEVKAEMDEIEELLKDAESAWQQESNVFYPIIDDEKQALKN